MVTNDPLLRRPERYLLGSVNVGPAFFGPCYAVIIDSETGRIVWYRKTPGSRLTWQPQVSDRGGYILIDQSIVYVGGDPEVLRTTLDLEQQEAVTLPNWFITYDELDDGTDPVRRARERLPVPPVERRSGRDLHAAVELLAVDEAVDHGVLGVCAEHRAVGPHPQHGVVVDVPDIDRRGAGPHGYDARRVRPVPGWLLVRSGRLGLRAAALPRMDGGRHPDGIDSTLRTRPNSGRASSRSTSPPPPCTRCGPTRPHTGPNTRARLRSCRAATCCGRRARRVRSWRLHPTVRWCGRAAGRGC